MRDFNEKQRRSMLCRAAAGAVLLAAVCAAPTWAFARSYVGYGDTGWTWDNKRDCCDDAVAIAQDDSAQMCLNAGGAPKRPTGTSRGTCDWDWADGYDGGRVYRCTAQADVYCR